MRGPMEIIGPVVGIGAIISFVVAGIVVLRLVPQKVAEQKLKLQAGEMDEIHARLGELDQLHQRMNELEERLDFTERLLARPPDDQHSGS